jgi:hypothetical protein
MAAKSQGKALLGLSTSCIYIIITYQMKGA